LFGLKERIIPRWRYAVPYFLMGLLAGGYTLEKGMDRAPAPVDPAPVVAPRESLRERLFE
jgi:hypothetical protein